MHELGITENILQAVLKRAAEEDAAQVTDVYLLNSPLTGVSDESVRFYWSTISQDTPCAGAELHFQHIPAKLICHDCGREFTTVDEMQLCPACAGSHVEILSGRSLQLESIEIET